MAQLSLTPGSCWHPAGGTGDGDPQVTEPVPACSGARGGPMSASPGAAAGKDAAARIAMVTGTFLIIQSSK